MTEVDTAKPTDESKTAVAKPEDVEVATSGPLLKRINALKNVQVQMVEIESKFYEELHQLECKYAKMYDPLFEKRRQIVVGEHEPSEEEGKWALDALNDEAGANGEAKENGAGGGKLGIDESKLGDSAKKLLSDLKAQFDTKKNGGTGGADEKGVPNFWLETLQSFRITAEIIQEHDEPILAYLQDVRVILADKKPYGYTIEFHFAENPYFGNKVLTKTYELKTEVDAKDPFAYEGPDLAKAIGCTIDWKAGKNVTVKLTKKKLKSKNKKIPPKVITKEEKQDSFFNFFETPKGQDKKAKSPASSGAEDNGGKKDSDKQLKRAGGGANEDEEDDEEDEDAQEELYMIADFEIGQYLREKVVPKAILYYTGELDGLEEDYDDYEDEDDEEGDEDEDEDDEEDDDDDDDDEEDDKKGGHKGAKKPAAKQNGPKGKTGGKPGEPTPNECKQN